MAILPAWTLGTCLEPTTALAGYGRQSWVMENGLPQNTVQALAQTRDGFVWLGTEVGLVRFDGVGFEVFDKNSTPALPGNDVQCLLAGSDGSLWVGTSEGLARWKEGAVTTFTTKDGLPGNDVLELWQVEDGSVGIWTRGGPANLSGGLIQPIKNVDAYPRRALPLPGEPRDRVLFEEQLSEDVFVMGGRGSLTLTQGKTAAHTTTTLATGKELPGTRIQTVMADHEHALWIGTNGGLARWVGGELDRLPVTDPLASASVLALMEDREGNLWVGTETGGLHILRDQRFKAMTSHDGLSSDNTTTVVEDRTGALWVGTSGSGLNVVGADSAPKLAVNTYTVHDGLPSDVILSLAAAPTGDMWVGTPDGLSRIRGRAVSTFTSADGLPDDFIRSLLVDGDGSLWIGTRRGLTHWTAARLGKRNGDLHPERWAGQRPGGRHGAR